jgi:hypothetical protein
MLVVLAIACSGTSNLATPEPAVKAPDEPAVEAPDAAASEPKVFPLPTPLSDCYTNVDTGDYYCWDEQLVEWNLTHVCAEYPDTPACAEVPAAGSNHGVYPWPNPPNSPRTIAW